jgi:hypothetical protein
MPLTPKEFEQIKKYAKRLPAGIDTEGFLDFLADYVEEPKIIPAAATDLQALLAESEAADLKRQAKQILEQKGRQEEGTGGTMAEIVSESDVPTYTQISEQVPDGAYLPLGDVVYKLSIVDGRRKLTADEAQTRRYLKRGK